MESQSEEPTTPYQDLAKKKKKNTTPYQAVTTLTHSCQVQNLSLLKGTFFGK